MGFNAAALAAASLKAISRNYYSLALLASMRALTCASLKAAEVYYFSIASSPAIFERNAFAAYSFCFFRRRWAAFYFLFRLAIFLY